MGLFSNLISGNRTPQDALAGGSRAPRQEQPGIAYDAGLIDTLKDDHHGLLQAFGTIRRAGAEGRFTHLAELLEQFRLMLLNHVALENVKFYVYMQNHANVDAATLTYIAGVRKEMNVIARTVAKFVDTYVANAPTHRTIFSFNEELEHIGEVLVQRIQLEEDRLYSLYRP